MPTAAPTPAQLADGLSLVAVAQIVAFQLLPADAASGTQDAAPVGPVMIGAGQVVVVKLLPASAGSGSQLATGTFAVTTGAGQVVVV